MFKSGIPVSCKENLILERKNMEANEHDSGIPLLNIMQFCRRVKTLMTNNSTSSPYKKQVYHF
jgi:hypothetical protein